MSTFDSEVTQDPDESFLTLSWSPDGLKFLPSELVIHY